MNDVFERCWLTESGFLHSWAVALTEASVKIVSMRVKTLGNTNLESSRNIKESLPVDVRRSGTFLLNLPFVKH